MLRNSHDAYGWVSIALHWLMALLIFGLFGLGLYMTDLTYYDPWYKKGPELHMALGVLVALLLLLRIGWRLGNPEPAMAGRPWERTVALWVHRGFYLLLLAIVVSGYLIPTAKGEPLWVYDWFSIPALFKSEGTLADQAGEVPFYLAWTTIVLAGLHAAAAFKHHFIERDATLIRMLGRQRRPGSR